ncbi:MAG: response regulator [Desulfobacteraceae bacterium]
MNYAQNVRHATALGNHRRIYGAGCDNTTAHGLTALVVDDDPITLKLAGAMLADMGYMVRTADEGTQGMIDFSRTPCDFVLTDYVMPAINGYQLGRRIKSRHPETRVVIMTGLSRIEVAGMMSDGSIDGWLFKPFDPADLKSLLEQLGLPVKGSAE